MYWDTLEAGPADPCSHTVMDCEPGQDFASTPRQKSEHSRSEHMVLEPSDVEHSLSEIMVLEPSEAATIGNDRRAQACKPEPSIPLDATNTSWDAFPPIPPQLPVRDDIGPEDAIDGSFPSLSELREGKTDTMG
jgi:hypothetical protein